MAMTAASSSEGPMMEINTTPLIDVMLVLLIMIIMTIPLQTHAVKIDLPQKPKVTQIIELADKNKVYIDPAGQVFWNSEPVDDMRLQQYLEQTANLRVEPELHFQPDPAARYDVVDRVLAIIKRSNVTKLGFVGNEQYRNTF